MPNRKISSSSRQRPARGRTHHRAQRQEAEQHELELRTQAPELPGGARRKKRAPLWKRLRLFALILLLAGGVELVVAGLTSPQFRVADVTVSGAQITPADEVLRVQQSLIGQNWVRAQTDLAQKKLMALPAVKSARVVRALHWPPHLHIHIEERAPFARVGAGQNWWIVDESGVAFRREAKTDENLYALTGPKFAPEPGVALPGEQWQPAARLVRTLSTQRAAWPLRRIYFDKNGFASLRMEGGAHDELLIRLGGDHWEEKLARARLALAYFDRTSQRAQSLNLVSYNMSQWTPLHPSQQNDSAVEDSTVP